MTLLDDEDRAEMIETTEVSIEVAGILLNTMAEKKIPEKVAKLAAQYYDSFITEGFSPDIATKLTIAAMQSAISKG